MPQVYVPAFHFAEERNGYTRAVCKPKLGNWTTDLAAFKAIPDDKRCRSCDGYIHRRETGDYRTNGAPRGVYRDAHHLTEMGPRKAFNLSQRPIYGRRRRVAT
jgi:hypothetical protein